ncbi:hypothetical protein [Roseovarius indicus]|uniref:Uncharacterized protein n=1 Tax=Roseovarius indicus TaxID=540747 RepID=A0A0T5P8M8_9RHOB|nr:hypothetical protein [Roseovarius indicus]KRS17345.1 hypothetical protein XM52_12640 [Roseovarius indicus]QEW26517.1 hypothetical protein RIdsm_02317 [Roseovarius indicus]SFD64082.1 hypothetical protein SAMN04488031_1011026 [Roseovarius indicus]
MDNRLSMLKETLRVLASPVDTQVAYLDDIDPEQCGVGPGELALEFDDMYRAIEAIKPDHAALFDELRKLDDLFGIMSATTNAHIWTFGALRHSEDWQSVRMLAKNCLARMPQY